MKDTAEGTRAASARAGGASARAGGASARAGGLRDGGTEVAADADPSRTLMDLARAVIVVVSLASALLLFDLAGGVEHATQRPLGVTVRLAGGWSMAAVVLTWLALVRPRAGLAPAHLAASAMAAPLVLFAWTQLFHGSYDEPRDGAGTCCFALMLLLAIIPFAGVMALHRAVSAVRAGPLGATVGAACGAWAGVVAALGCPRTGAVHVLLGHVSPVGVLVAAGALAGARLLTTPAR